MLHHRNFAIGNVRIDRYLRWRGDGNGNHDTCDGGNVVIGNITDIGNVDNLRDAGNLGTVGNVRFRLEQRCFIVDANVNVTHDAGRRCSNGTPIGIYRDRQSWGQLRCSRTNNDRIAHCGYRGSDTDDAHHHLYARCFIHDDKPIPVPRRRRDVKRLLKQPFNRELDQP
jgi:hypothetical protein